MLKKCFAGMLTIVLLITVLPGVTNAQKPAVDGTKGIVFIEDTWGEALKQAAAQHKYIFVDAYATWCGPCKMLKNTTFKDRKAADFYNKNFINVAIDMEKGEGPQLAAQWRMEAYPTLIIFDSKGKPVLGTVGYIKAADLIKFGEAALKK
jgi:thiol:disulfide interchange protein